MTKDEFLDRYIFEGLTNLNDGFDAASIKYYSEDDFRVVLDRVEKLNLEVHGIEPWKNKEYYDCKVFEAYEESVKDASDPRWYRSCFEAFAKEDDSLIYSASYGVPYELLID